MKILKYFFHNGRIILYSAASLLLALTLYAFTGHLIQVFFEILLIIVLVRVIDDLFDYDQDAGKRNQYLGKRELALTGTILAFLFAAVSVLFFGRWGWFSLLFIGWLILEEYLDIMEILLPPLFALYLICAYRFTLSTDCLIFSAVLLLISAAFKSYKSKRR